MTSPNSPTLSKIVPPIQSSFDFERGEVLNINKPAGWTSFDVVKKVRCQLGIRKVGHAGTLDPFATGVLLICTGRATKRVEKLMNLDKEYIACIEFGKVTDTFDCTGTVLTKRDASHLTLEDVKSACEEFQGEIFQTPPMFSAVKVKGERLYNLARKGVVVPRKARKICVYDFEILNYENPFLRLKVVCSRGTYIRAIANDMGEMLGCGGFLKELTRTRIGNYCVEESLEISKLVRDVKINKLL